MPNEISRLKQGQVITILIDDRPVTGSFIGINQEGVLIEVCIPYHKIKHDITAIKQVNQQTPKQCNNL